MNSVGSEAGMVSRFEPPAFTRIGTLLQPPKELSTGVLSEWKSLQMHSAGIRAWAAGVAP
jgi:hypothetical protein